MLIDFEAAEVVSGASTRKGAEMKAVRRMLALEVEDGE